MIECIVDLDLVTFLTTRHYVKSRTFPRGLPRYPIIGTLSALDPELESKLILASRNGSMDL
jgi:hypothetical protein